MFLYSESETEKKKKSLRHADHNTSPQTLRLFEKRQMNLLVKEDVVLWTDTQCLPDDLHITANVQPLDVHRPRGRREQSCQDRSIKQTSSHNQNDYFDSSPSKINNENYSKRKMIKGSHGTLTWWWFFQLRCVREMR